MPSSILVTGGAGFIGSHTVDVLVERGMDVIVFDDLSIGKLGYINKKCEFVQGNIDSRQDIQKAIENYKPEIIVNFAVRCLMQSIVDPDAIHRTNVGGAINILEAIRLVDPKIRFVQISSSEAYGSALQVPQQEGHPMNPTTPYGASKAAADMYVKSYHLCYGIPTMIVRPFNSYGPRMRTDVYCAVMYSFYKRLIEDKDPIIFGDGLQTRDLSYVSDTGRGIADALFCDVLIGHLVHIASGKETTILEIARICNKIFKRDPDRIEFKEPRQGEVRRHCADISRAKRLFNYEPKTNVEEGVKRTFKWLEKYFTSDSNKKER